MEVIKASADRPVGYQGFSSENFVSLEAAKRFVRPISIGPVENLFYRYKNEIDTFPASQSNHQWWTGGWKDHVAQMVNIGMGNLHCVGMGDIISIERFYILCLLHDLEKLRRYRLGSAQRSSIKNLAGKLIEITPYWSYKVEYETPKRELQEDLESIQMASELGFKLDNWLINGIAWAAGGFSLFAKTMTPLPLSPILHAADFISANNLPLLGDHYE